MTTEERQEALTVMECTGKELRERKLDIDLTGLPVGSIDLIIENFKDEWDAEIGQGYTTEPDLIHCSKFAKFQFKNGSVLELCEKPEKVSKKEASDE